jgi:hypothetical protein
MEAIRVLSYDSLRCNGGLQKCGTQNGKMGIIKVSVMIWEVSGGNESLTSERGASLTTSCSAGTAFRGQEDP